MAALQSQEVHLGKGIAVVRAAVAAAAAAGLTDVAGP